MAAHATGAGIFAEAAVRARQRPARGMDKEWVGVLAQVPLFAQIPKRHLRRIARLATARRFAGGPIFRAGDEGDAFYVVLDGNVQVHASGGRKVKLGAGDYFGEMALLDGARRSATVEAVGEVLTMRIGRSAFAKLLKQEPQIAVALLAKLADRIRQLERKPAARVPSLACRVGHRTSCWRLLPS